MTETTRVDPPDVDGGIILLLIIAVEMSVLPTPLIRG